MPSLHTVTAVQHGLICWVLPETPSARVGQLRADVDPVVAAEMIYGPPFYRWLLRIGDLDEGYRDRLIEQVLAGLVVGTSS